jgi:hypothetical protein
MIASDSAPHLSIAERGSIFHTRAHKGVKQKPGAWPGLLCPGACLSLSSVDAAGQFVLKDHDVIFVMAVFDEQVLQRCWVGGNL